MRQPLIQLQLICALLTPGIPQLAPALAQDSLELSLRYRTETADGSGFFHTSHRSENWAPEQTALIICDMWDAHHCLNAVRREKEMAPRLEQVTKQLRDTGVTIIHAPSSCMDFYKEHAARKRAASTELAKDLPKDIDAWCRKIPEEEGGEYPIDQTDGGEDDDPLEHAEWAEELAAKGLNPRAPWKRQIDVISIDEDKDYISDSGSEIWSILSRSGIKNVILAGVHTNMCVLGRPFGLRQMARNGKNVVLMRDLTDTMYNPEARPFVSHFTGTDLIIEHIEKFVCPTITSHQITGAEEFRYSTDKRPHVAMLVGEREYKTDQSLRKYALSHLGKHYKTSFVYADEEDRNDFPGIEAIDHADLLLVSVRRRTPKPEQLAVIQKHIFSGKPVVGIRTANHAFSLRTGDAPEGHTQWTGFDADVFGGSYTNHYGNKLETTVSFANITHPIFDKIQRRGFISGGSLYKVAPLKTGATILMNGKVKSEPSEPVAWTFRREDGGRSFYTSLGHEDDFKQQTFTDLLTGAISWALAK